MTRLQEIITELLTNETESLSDVIRNISNINSTLWDECRQADPQDYKEGQGEYYSTKEKEILLAAAAQLELLEQEYFMDD